MALVIKKPISLKERLMQKAAEEPQMAVVVAQPIPVVALAEAAKVEESKAVVIDQAPASQDSISDLAAQQAYSDVLPRINGLVALSGEALEKEMSILKKALIENPDACAIMLPEDIGKMVAALRTMTGQALSEAVAKPKGKGKAPKQLALTAEAMEAAFDEL